VDRATAKQKRKEIITIIRTAIPNLKGRPFFCDKREKDIPTNIYGHTIKWWLSNAPASVLSRINVKLKPLGVECRVDVSEYGGSRRIASLKVYKINYLCIR